MPNLRSRITRAERAAGSQDGPAPLYLIRPFGSEDAFDRAGTAYAPADVEAAEGRGLPVALIQIVNAPRA